MDPHPSNHVLLLKQDVDEWWTFSKLDSSAPTTRCYERKVANLQKESFSKETLGIVRLTPHARQESKALALTFLTPLA